MTEEDLLLETRAIMGDHVAKAQITFNDLAKALGVTPEWFMEKAILYQETGEHSYHPDDPFRFQGLIFPNAIWQLYGVINSCVAIRRGSFFAWSSTIPPRDSE